nr:uncharacterized protein LOC132761709 [Anolis sagrei ordinatus]
MGGSVSSKPKTPLELMLAHFDKSFGKLDYGEPLRPSRLQTLCQKEWVKFSVGWPEEGTLDQQIIASVYDRARGANPFEGSYPTHIPYILAWGDVVRQMPEWLKPCALAHCKTLLAQKTKAPILPCPVEEEINAPPPYSTGELIAPQAPAIPALDPAAVSPPTQPMAPAQLYPDLPEDLDDDTDSTMTESSSTPSPEKESLQAKATLKAAKGHDHNLRNMDKANKKLATVMPLRQVREFIGTQVEGGQQVPQFRPAFTHVPFTSSDLFNWKTHTTPFSTDPGPMTDVFTNIVNTHDPTWQDCQQLMTSLLTTEERKRVLAAMKRQTEARRNAAVNLVDHMRENCPETDPQWDPNTADQLTRIRQYGQLMIQGLAEAGKKPTNLSKVKEIKQGADESPGAYLERLLSAYRQYTPFNPAEEANRNMVNATFVEQSAPDIRRKLQKLDGFAGMNMSQLIEIANRVMANRDQEEKRDKQRQMRAQAICLAAALREWNPEIRQSRGQSRGRSRGRSYGPGRGQPLGQDQCSNCKQRGHWRRDCPQIRRGRGRGHPQEQRGRGSEMPGRQRPFYQEAREQPEEEGFIGLAGGPQWSGPEED